MPRSTRRGSATPGTRFIDTSVLGALELGATLAHAEPLHARLARANLLAVQRLGVERSAGAARRDFARP